mgnify:FL=1|jgi:hypothetical protein
MQPGSTFGQQRGGQGALCVTFGTWGNANASNPPRGNGLIHIRIITVFFGAAVRSLVRCGTCQKVVVSLSIFRIRNDSRELYDANRCSKMVVCLFFPGCAPGIGCESAILSGFRFGLPGLAGRGACRRRKTVPDSGPGSYRRRQESGGFREADPPGIARQKAGTVYFSSDGFSSAALAGCPLRSLSSVGLRRSSKCCPR